MILAPSERAVVDVLFDQPGQLELEHRTPDRTYRLADDHRHAGPASRRWRSSSTCCARTRSWPPSGRDGRRGWRPSRTRRWRWSPRWTWTHRAGAGDGRLHLPDAPGGDQRGAGPLPAVRDEAAGDRRAERLRVPDAPGGHQRAARPLPAVRHEAGAGRPRRQAATATTSTVSTTTSTGTAGHDHEATGGIEWEDDMVEVNRLTTPANMRWKLVDRRPAPRTTRSTGGSASATGSRSGWSTRWTPTIRCTTRSTCTGPAGSWS